MDITGILLGGFGLAVGGFLKGAVGAGAPLVAVPLLALLYDVPLAVAIFTIPSLLSNIWQGWAYRAERGAPRFVWTLALAAGIGAVFGSLILAWLPGDMLMAGLSMIVFLYIGFRLYSPDWVLGRGEALRLAAPAGLAAGIMQGAGGISAPVSITFLNAMRMERGEFIATIAIFFGVMSASQIPALVALGIMTPERAILSVLGCIPLFGAMPLGAWVGRRVSKEVFDRLILWLLAAIALRLLWVAFT